MFPYVQCTPPLFGVPSFGSKSLICSSSTSGTVTLALLVKTGVISMCNRITDLIWELSDQYSFHHLINMSAKMLFDSST